MQKRTFYDVCEESCKEILSGEFVNVTFRETFDSCVTWMDLLLKRRGKTSLAECKGYSLTIKK